MDPTIPSPGASPQSFGGVPVQPDGGGKRLPKKPLLIGGIVILIVIGIVLLTLLRGDTSGNSDGVYYDRPGYDRKNLSAGTGDPAAFSPTSQATPVSYQNVPMIQACNILSVKDLAASGQLLHPNPLPASIDRTFFDGQGTGTMQVSDFFLPTSGNQCQYILQGRKAVHISVYQPPIVAAGAVDREINRRYTSLGESNGIKTHSRKVDADIYYMLRSDKGAIEMYMEDDEAAPKLLDLAVANLSRELAQPTGPWKAAYSSPTFKKSSANACALIAAEDVKTIFGREASPLAEEKLATATGVVQFGGEKADPYSYIAQECLRRPVRTPEDSSVVRKSLTLQTYSYTNEEAAKSDMAYRRQSGQSASVSTKIGDEVLFSTAVQDQLMIRKGRIVLRISYNDKRTSQDAPPVDKQITTLVPVGQAVVDRLKDF